MYLMLPAMPPSSVAIRVEHQLSQDIRVVDIYRDNTLERMHGI